MKQWLVLVVVCVASAVLCIGSSTTKLPTSVSLQRTYCFGPCPVYRVTLRPSGRVFFEGEANVERLGRYTAEISPSDYEKIAEVAQQSGFYKLKPSYDSGVTCQPSAITRIVSGADVKEVSNEGECGPKSLWALEQIIDGVVAKATGWERVESPDTF